MSEHTPETFELRFHHAIPGWCKIIGLNIREIPECEGAGFMVEENEARRIVAAINAVKDIPTEALEGGVVGELINEVYKALLVSFETLEDHPHPTNHNTISNGINLALCVLAKAKGGSQ